MPPRPHPNTYWVNEHLLAGPYPKNVPTLLDAGITYFVNLTEAQEPLSPYAHQLDPDQYQRIPIQDFSIPTPETMRTILNALDEAIQTGQHAYVHCWGGRGRTGTVVGCYLVRHGMTGEEALAKVQALYSTTQKSQRADKDESPETPEQRTYILNWKQHDRP